MFKFKGSFMSKDILTEKNELAIMRDSLKIGLFFMDRNFIIQDQYSGYLGAMFADPDLGGKSFIDLLSSQISVNDTQALKDYLNMIFDEAREQYILDEINPLTEFEYTAPGSSKPKIFEFNFTAVRRANEEMLVLVSVYDITSKVELQRKLQEESVRRHEEMQAVFEFIQIDPEVLDEFIEDMEYEFKKINDALKDHELSPHEILIKIYQSVHSIKSNAFTLEQNTFGNKVHKTEDKIKKLSGQNEVTFNDMLNLTKDLEKLTLQKENFKVTREKIRDHILKNNTDTEKQAHQMFVNTLNQTVRKVSSDLGKEVRLVVSEFDYKAIKKDIRKVIKDVVMQLIRNSIVHGIDKSGQIKLSINVDDDKIDIRYADNGKGFDFKKIAEKAVNQNLIKREDVNNKDKLIKAVFSPGFSTACNESIHGGRGIGLNLVHDRVRENNGIIKVKTESGKGTMFNIIFQDENTIRRNYNDIKKKQKNAA